MGVCLVCVGERISFSLKQIETNFIFFVQFDQDKALAVLLLSVCLFETREIKDKIRLVSELC